MALQPLLSTRAVIDLCSGDVMLPSNPTALEETPESLPKTVMRSMSADVVAEISSMEAFFEDPTAAVKGLAEQGASSWVASVAKAAAGKAKGFVGELLVAKEGSQIMIPVKPEDCAKGVTVWIEESGKMIQVEIISIVGDEITVGWGEGEQRKLGPDDAMFMKSQSRREIVPELPSADVGSSPTLAMLMQTLSLGASLVRKWAADAPRDSPRHKTWMALENCLQLTRMLPRPLLAEHSSARRNRADLQNQFAYFLAELVGQIRGVQPGGVMMIPAGWLRSRCSSLEGAATTDNGHCILLVLQREWDKEEFKLGVVNTGAGLLYHPSGISCEAPSPELETRQSPLLLTSIPASNIVSSSFWYLMYRQILYPDKSNGPDITYGLMLPALNQRPLSSNFGTEPEDWVTQSTLPVSGDISFAICMERAIKFTMRAAGASPAEAAFSVVELRRVLVSSIHDALKAMVDTKMSLSVSERAFVRNSTLALARATAEQGPKLMEQIDDKRFKEIQDIIESTEKAVFTAECEEVSVQAMQPPPVHPEHITSANMKKTFDHFDCLLRENMDSAKGDIDRPRIFVPVLTCMLPVSVVTPTDVASACRLVTQLLTQLANQQDQIHSSVPARFALVSHLMTRLLPMPLPVDHPEKKAKCFWAQDMLYETKSDIMRNICLISRHFAAVAFTLQANREMDGGRVCVAAGLAALMDALLRQPVHFVNAPILGEKERMQLYGSLMSLHYCGQAEGPCKPFGVDSGAFERKSETLLLVTPEYASLRALALDYFRSIRTVVDEAHLIFQFDSSMECSQGDRSFVEQVGLCLGVSAAQREAHLLLSGRRPELLEIYPEIGWFRDVVFLWKMLLLPGGSMPPQKNWRATDCELQWSCDGDSFVVHGFETKLSAKAPELAPQRGWWPFAAGSQHDEYESHDKAISMASASNLAGSKIQSEDDVLFLESVPNFNKTLAPQDSELLLTYLTAPYLRIPLLLGFFTDRQRASLLREPQLQSILDAALFEPGPWSSSQDATTNLPETIPAPDRAHLKTPVGLLLNEIVKSPDLIITAVISMLRAAVDKDNGKPCSANENLILYLVRLAVRVESYLLFVIRHIERDAYLERSGAGHEAKVPGLPGHLNGQDVYMALKEKHAILRTELENSVYWMLSDWSRQATNMRTQNGMIHAASRAHAHLALIFKNVPATDMQIRSVAVALSSQIFLNMNHRFQSVEQSKKSVAKNSLGVSEFELFDCFEAKRSMLAAWLREKLSDSPKDATEVLEKIERVATFRGTVEQLNANETQQGDREWEELFDQPGCFVPKVENGNRDWRTPLSNEAFDPWLLRVCFGPPEIAAKISLNLGLYETRQNKIQMLPAWAAESEDYLDAFGRIDAQCFDKEVSVNCICKELSGLRHEIQRWVPSDSPQDKTSSDWRAWVSNFVSSTVARKYEVDKLGKKEQWLGDVLEPVLAKLGILANVELYLKTSVPDHVDAKVWLTGFVEKQVVVGNHVGHLKQVKEVLVQRSPALVEVYDIMQYGRQKYKSLVFSSDVMWSLHTPAANEQLLFNSKAKAWCISSGTADDCVSPGQSVLVFRNLNQKLGYQMYIPNRLLQGLLPDALLERYRFWRPETGENVLIGDEREKIESPKRLHVHIQQARDGQTVATVRRYSLTQSLTSLSFDYWDTDPTKEIEVLVDLRENESALGLLLTRLENLSHILVWAGETKDSTIRCIELPRLHLGFTHEHGRLYCDQQSGYWLATHSFAQQTQTILTQFGGGTVVLENSAGELLIIVSAAAEPILPAAWGANVEVAEHFLQGQLMFRRGHQSWLANLSEGSRCYCFPVHLSGTFVFTPTWASRLYLLLCRLATWDFSDVATMSLTISETVTPEEKQLWSHLKYFVSEQHADAIACRLLLTLAARPFGDSMATTWDLKAQLIEYARKRHLVSPNCALNPQQELSLFSKVIRAVGEDAINQEKDLRMRFSVLQTIVNQSGAEIRVRIPDVGKQLDDIGFDLVDDQTCLEGQDVLGRISALGQLASYHHPEGSMKGVIALQFLDELFQGDGITSLNVHFWLLYEIFTGSFDICLLHGDNSNVLGSLLMRIAARDKTRSTEFSMLRALNANPEFCGDMPKWGSPETSVVKGEKASLVADVMMVGGHLSAGNLMKAALQFLRDKHSAGSLRWRTVPAQKQFEKPCLTLPPNFLKNPRFWTGPLTREVSCSVRTCQDRGQNFGGRPLEAFASKHVKSLQIDHGAHKDIYEACELLSSKSLIAKSYVGQETLQRLLTDLKVVGDAPTSQLAIEPSTNLEEVCKELVALKAHDMETLLSEVEELLRLANKGSATQWLQRKGGHIAQVKFGMVARALMAEQSEATEAFQAVNADITEDDIESMFDKVAAILCYASRVGHASRVLAAIHTLQKARQSGAVGTELRLREEAVARELNACRHFAKASSTPQCFDYDPRLLVFECLFNMMLRKSQVELVQKFMKSATDHSSLCHQMIMGAGKTTVIAPVLALLLADGKTLLVACMPHELLTMTRAVMMEKFSSPILPKPVLTLVFERFTVADNRLLAKVQDAVRRRAVVCATPTSLKSILLKQVELLCNLHDNRAFASEADREAERQNILEKMMAGRKTRNRLLDEAQVISKTEELRVCSEIIKICNNGAMLMDEVDLLLDPRKSELNWPLGDKKPLDLTEGCEGLRYTFPFHLLDAFFCHDCPAKMILPFHDRSEANDALKGLAKAIKVGTETRQVQIEPHFILLSRKFYASEMLPHLASWSSLFLEGNMEGLLNAADLRTVLGQEGQLVDAIKSKLANASGLVLQQINFVREWLHSLLPHLLSRVHRVSYGLLIGEDLAKAENAREPRSRRLLAVPFVGKDRPSTMSEFQHPDLTIGLTILAFRFDGMRPSDLRLMFRSLLYDMELENSVQFHRRSACRSYVNMVSKAGWQVRGFTETGVWIEDLDKEAQNLREKRIGSQDQDAPRPVKLWPLEMLDLADPEQQGTLFSALCRSPDGIKFFLERIVFQPHSGVIDAVANQLTASGQELGGPQLFRFCLGFSGTPNNLLPKAMGSCKFTKGDDGAILQVLSDPHIVSVKAISSWTATTLLDMIATSKSESGGSKYHALIDTGALITGMSNYEVAKYLLSKGLQGILGVVFLNAHDQQMVLIRSGMRVLELAQCGLSPTERFTFFDHVHTTGMDIKQPLSCTACQTLSKDMTFRDYAQGAYRMRGIGQGQCIEVFLIPEVASLIHSSLCVIESTSVEARKSKDQELLENDKNSWSMRNILDIIKWLTLNGISSESKRHRLLCRQSVHNLWRESASAWLQIASSDANRYLGEQRTMRSKNVLQTRVDTAIPNELPGDPVDYAKQLADDLFEKVRNEPELWDDADSKNHARDTGLHIINELKAGSVDDCDDSGGNDDLEKNQVKEEENEKEEQRQVERHEENTREIEQNQAQEPEEAAKLDYSRDEVAPTPWQLSALYDSRAAPFYPLSEFYVSAGVLGQARPLNGLPPYVLMSENYYKRSWRLTSCRRLRNIICFVEWVPDRNNIKRLEVQEALSDHQLTTIREAFLFWDLDKSGKIGGQELLLLLRDLGMEQEADGITKTFGQRELSCQEIQEHIASKAFYRMQEGRYYVALSLEEAEHLRAAMHLLIPGDWPSKSPGSTGFALRSLSTLESVLRDSLIDSYGPVHETVEATYQLETSEQLLRFVNSFPGFQGREMSILLRSLQHTAVEKRLSWWLNIRRCRRRMQRPWDQLPVASVFEKSDEFDDLVTRAFLSRVRWKLAVLRITAADAYRKIDTNGSGKLTKVEFIQGLEWMQVNQLVEQACWLKHVSAAFEFLDKQGTAGVDMETFKNALELKEEDKLSVPSYENISSLGLAPAEQPKGDAGGEGLLVPELMRTRSRGRFEVSWAVHHRCKCIWTSRGTLSNKTLSIWEPYDLGKGFLTTVADTLCTGHFASNAADFQMSPTGVPLLYIRDTQASGVFSSGSRADLERFVDMFFPHPVRFRKIWSLQPPSAAGSGAQQLHMWKVIPPSEHYAALGDVATTTDCEPNVNIVRCVPKSWLQETLSKQLWTDEGMSGQRASLWMKPGEEPMMSFQTTTGDQARIAPKMFVISRLATATQFYEELPSNEDMLRASGKEVPNYSHQAWEDHYQW